MAMLGRMAYGGVGVTPLAGPPQLVDHCYIVHGVTVVGAMVGALFSN